MQDGASPGKRAVSLSIDEELVKAAEAAEINLSVLLELAVEQRLKEERWRTWRAENRGSIDSMNEYVSKHGLLSDKYRVR